MGNETTAAKRRTSGPRARTTGLEVVGDYAGQHAGDAAQAVRRAGLRPGLERSFGDDPALLGLVVSQDPPAGSALARNGMVTLHVAAPGNASASDDTAPGAPSEPARASEATGQHEPAPAPEGAGAKAAHEGMGGSRRPRKPRGSGHAREAFTTAPAPVLASAQPGQEPVPGYVEAAQDELADPLGAEDAGGAERSEEVSEVDGFNGLTRDEFVVHVDDVFAGRTGRWRVRRRAPRTRRGLRGWAKAHPWLAGASTLAVTVWLLVGTLGALGSQHSTPGHTIARPGARAHVAHSARVASTPTADRARPARRRATRAPHAPTRQVAPATRRAHARRRQARDARPRAAATAPRTPPQASVPAAEQSSGGLFSP
jgi:hypothetical protein